MKEHYIKTYQNTQTDFSHELQPITKETFDYLQKTILRFKKSKDRTNSFLKYTEKLPKVDLEQKKLTSGTLEAVNGCGSWLEFRNYLKVDKTKLHHANFCKKDKLCPACAMRRASKQVKKVHDYFNQNEELKKKYWYYIVLPVKHNKEEDFETVFNRAKKGLDTLRTAIKDNKRGKGRESFFSQFNGLFYSFEVTKTKNGWNNHINIMCCADKEIKGIYTFKDKNGKKVSQHKEIMRDWQKYTDNKSFMHSINKIDISTEDKLIKNLLEIFKYSLKFQDLSNEDLLEVYEKTHNKRLLGAFGSLYGIKTNVDLEGEEILGDKYLEIVYTYNYETRKYKERSRAIKTITEEEKKSKSKILDNLRVFAIESEGRSEQRKNTSTEQVNKNKTLPVTIYDKYGLIEEKFNKPILKNITDYDIFKRTQNLKLPTRQTWKV